MVVQQQCRFLILRLRRGNNCAVHSRQAGHREIEPNCETVDQCERVVLACDAVEFVGNR
jgi:hypothetical protein